MMVMEKKKLRIDSHQHSHMIPVVWDALTDSINDEGFDPEYIRNSAEPLIPFLTKPSFVRTYRPVNIIKNRLCIRKLFFIFFTEVRKRLIHFTERHYRGIVFTGRLIG